jgi:hypothetical protein
MQTARELWQLVVAYFKQETIEPLKGLLRFLLWGTIGSFCLGIGAVLLLIGLLRVLQTETGDALDGTLSFLPYVIVLVVAGIIAGLSASRIGAEKRKTEGAS